MSRAAKALLTLAALPAVGVLATACGTEKIALSKSNPLYQGAVLFNQRCAGCHTLSYAATHGSAVNVQSTEFNNGPDFDIRCERPVARVLYAIENGGFSGAIMPQNVVVGQQAIEVAKFVATYAGRQAPRIPGVTPCDRLPIGTIPAPPSATAAAPTTTAAVAPTAGTTATAAPKPARGTRVKASTSARASASTKARARAKSKRP